MASVKRPIDAPADGESVIGLIGPQAAVRDMQAVGRELLAERPALQARFLAAPVPIAADPVEHFRLLAGRVHSAVFAGQLQFDRAHTDAGGQASIPSAYVAGTETSLFAALIRAHQERPFPLARASIDSLTQAQVQEAYGELKIAADDVEVAPYRGPQSVEHFTRFHIEARERGAELALTTRTSVQRELAQLGIPVELVRPTRGTLREALERGIALAGGVRLEEQQIACAFVSLIGDVEKAHGGVAAYWEQEAGLRLHRSLIGQTREIGAVVTRRSDTTFAVLCTRGGIDEITAQLTAAPFLGAVHADLRLPVAVGIGMGGTAHAAEQNAATALTASIAARGEVAVVVDEQGRTRELAPSAWHAAGEDTIARERAIVDDLLRGREGSDEPIDVDEVSRILGVTKRTGHRMLTLLVEAGLAWPLPAQTPVGGGRPRKWFRLLAGSMSD